MTPFTLSGCKCDAPINLAISYSRKYKLPIYVDNDDEVDAIKSISKDVSVFSVMKPKVMNTHILYLPNSNRDNENARKRLARASQLALCSIIVITDSQEKYFSTLGINFNPEKSNRFKQVAAPEITATQTMTNTQSKSQEKNRIANNNNQIAPKISTAVSPKKSDVPIVNDNPDIPENDQENSMGVDFDR